MLTTTDWFVNATKVWVSTIAPGPGNPGKFGMTFTKYATVHDGEGGEKMFDADNKVVDMSGC